MFTQIDATPATKIKSGRAVSVVATFKNLKTLSDRALLSKVRQIIRSKVIKFVCFPINPQSNRGCMQD